MTAPTLDPALDFAQWAAEVHALAERARRGDPGAQLPGPGDPGRRPPRRRLAGAVPDRGHRAAVDHRVLRRALHGRDREDPLAGQDRADPGRAGRLLAGRLADRRRAAGLEGAEPRRGRGVLRQHHRRGEGADRHLLHLVQRRRGGPVDPRRHPGAVRPRPVPRRARPADPGPGQHLGVGRRVPRARRDQRRPAHRAGARPTRTPTSTSTPSAAARPARCTWRAPARCRPTG